MYRSIPFSFGLQAGALLWKITGLVSGLILLSVLGQVLMGAYVSASLWLIAVLVFRRGFWWLLNRQARRA